jgi:hypothetical protein
MTIYRITQGIEIKFWNIITPMMSDEGVLMKTIRSTKRGVRGQPLNIALLILIWAAIGFVSGMLIGRIILILQLL